MSVQLQIAGGETLTYAVHWLRSVADFDLREALGSVGAIVKSQTQRRINEEKSSPDGLAWPEWSEGYAASQHGPFKAHAPHPGALVESGGHSLLELTGDLLKSIQHEVSGDRVEIGSNLVYAATHQFGDPARGIPARPFFGLSEANADEIESVIADFLSGVGR